MPSDELTQTDPRILGIVDKIQKGDIIPSEELENLIGENKDTQAYGFAVMGLKALLEKLLKQRGTAIIFKQENWGLVALTDPQAVRYNNSQFNRCLGAIFRIHERGKTVDPQNLTLSDKQRHERNLQRQGFYCAAIVGARKEIARGISSKRLPSAA